jgi:hypothetical protein
MLTAGSLTDCSFSGLALVARFWIPPGVTSLVFDDNAIVPINRASRSGSLLSVSLAGGSESETLEQRWPSEEAFVALDGETLQSDWQQVRVPVQSLAGSQAVLTLRLRPFGVLGPPPFCLAGVLLLDHLRFE